MQPGAEPAIDEQIPDALRRHTELTLNECAEEFAELRSSLERLDAGLANIDQLAKNSPELAAVVLGLPFAAGYIAGRARGRAMER